ncbi:MAG: Nif3-like dinuclear metal center hexameric protein [Opitutaceae bacterium]|nr:Nif3-like dinuclear metal center hexameric protein [Cytophagales bacterium]
MLLSEIIKAIEEFAPLDWQEPYDNTGLHYGNVNTEIGKVLLTLDVTLEVIEEAKEKGCNLIISHHPVIFKPLKSLTGNSLTEKIIIGAVRHDIALYSAHTNLDNCGKGVNYTLAKLLGLKDIKILNPLIGNLRRLIVYAPLDSSEKILNALYSAGAGQIGNYRECSFKSEGVGTFIPSESANPAIGSANKREIVNEFKIEVLFPAYLQQKVVEAMYNSHPYEEVAYDLIHLNNQDLSTGSGAIGNLENEMNQEEFLAFLKQSLNLKAIKFTPFNAKIKRVAVCGGSGSFLVQKAIKQKATAFVSSDFKYHEYFEAGKKLMIADIGHYESEVHTKELFYNILTKKMPNIAILFSTINTNPVKYYL